MKETPFACDMSAIEPLQRSRHIETMKELFNSVKEVSEIKNGFVFLFPNDGSVLINLMAFIEKERLCCPFFGFIIEIEPEKGNIFLKINGRDGVKEFIKAEFKEYVTIS